MGKRLKDMYPHATKWQVFKYRIYKFFMQILTWTIVAGVLYGTFSLGRYLYPATIITTTPVIQEVDKPAAVLARIAQCESHNSQYDKKTGQVLLNGNKNGSVDIGKFQINDQIWGAQATSLHYNLMVEADNVAFANYLYHTYGTEPWVWTKPCWNK